jgi:predicted negative regulator of RcsB-dependent stress response
MFTKQDLIKSAILIWIIGSITYIGWDAWNDYKIRGIQQAYQTGLNDATKQLFEKNQAGQCKEPITVTLGENKLELIDVKCLNQAPESAPTQAPAVPKK